LTTNNPNIEKMSDFELIDSILETQNEKCVETLYDRYSNKIYRKCLTFVKETNLAEDLTHDIFIKSLLNLSKFNKKSQFSTWLYSITYNYCIDYLRKSKKQNYISYNIEDKIAQDVAYEETDDLINIETSRMFKLLDMIRSDEKLILITKYQDGLSIKEIAKMLEITESAVKMRLKRAKEKMKNLYNQIYNKQ